MQPPSPSTLPKGGGRGAEGFVPARGSVEIRLSRNIFWRLTKSYRLLISACQSALRRPYQFEIQTLRAIETEALAEKCLASRQQRWEQLGRDLRRVEQELAKRDLGDVPTARLLREAARLRAEVSREAGDLRFSTSVKSIPNDEYSEDVLDWQV